MSSNRGRRLPRRLRTQESNIVFLTTMVLTPPVISDRVGSRKDKEFRMNTPRSESAKQVMKWASDYVSKTAHDYTVAMCDQKARQSAEKLWASFNPDDGVGGPFSSNPYKQPPNEEASISRLLNEANRAQEVLSFVTNQLCQLVNENSKPLLNVPKTHAVSLSAALTGKYASSIPQKLLEGSDSEWTIKRLSDETGITMSQGYITKKRLMFLGILAPVRGAKTRFSVTADGVLALRNFLNERTDGLSGRHEN